MKWKFKQDKFNQLRSAGAKAWYNISNNIIPAIPPGIDTPIPIKAALIACFVTNLAPLFLRNSKTLFLYFPASELASYQFSLHLGLPHELPGLLTTLLRPQPH